MAVLIPFMVRSSSAGGCRHHGRIMNCINNMVTFTAIPAIMVPQEKLRLEFVQLSDDISIYNEG